MSQSGSLAPPTRLSKAALGVCLIKTYEIWYIFAYKKSFGPHQILNRKSVVSIYISSFAISYSLETLTEHYELSNFIYTQGRRLLVTENNPCVSMNCFCSMLSLSSLSLLLPLSFFSLCPPLGSSHQLLVSHLPPLPPRRLQQLATLHCLWFCSRFLPDKGTIFLATAITGLLSVTFCPGTCFLFLLLLLFVCLVCMFILSVLSANVPINWKR